MYNWIMALLCAYGAWGAWKLNEDTSDNRTLGLFVGNALAAIVNAAIWIRYITR